MNIGSGEGTTVKEFVNIFEKVIGKEIKKEDSSSRPGDVAGQYASVDLAKRLIKWRPSLSVEDGIRSTLEWWGVRNKILNY
jgi:UDP-glucose 4-epimerase